MTSATNAADRQHPAPPPVPERLSIKALLCLFFGAVAMVGYQLIYLEPHYRILYRIMEGAFLVDLVALALGLWALEDIRRGRGRIRGRTLAWGGVAVASVLLVLGGYLGMVGIASPRMASANNLKQIALSLQSYRVDHGHFPPAVVLGKDGQPLYSWRVLLLPYLEQEELYRQFHLDEPWDSPHNLTLLPRMPQIYAWPGPQPPGPSETYYQVIVGPGAAFEGSRGPKLLDDFPDGTSYTFLVVEATDGVPWTSPVDLAFNPNGPLPALGGPSPPRAAWYEVPRSPHFNAALVDCSVRNLHRDSTTEEQIRAYITRNGGEKVED
jgi:Protein of unknown function (DUF1559)